MSRLRSGLALRRAQFFLLTGTATVAFFLLLACLPTFSVASSSAFMQSYSVPAPPLNIVADDAGRVWFTMPDADAIGMLDISGSQPQVVQYDLAGGSAAYDLVYDPSGYLWFTELQGNRIGRLHIATGTIEEYQTLPGSAPTGIAQSDDGKIWFAERDGDKLGMFDPSTGILEEYPFPDPLKNAQAEDVVVQRKGCFNWSPDSAGCIRITAPGVNQIYGFIPDTGQFFNFATSDIVTQETYAEPWNLATNETSDKLFMTIRAGNRLASFYPGTLTFLRFTVVPTANSGPTGIAYSRTGSLSSLWFTEHNSGRVGRFTFQPNGNRLSLLEQPLPSPTSRPNGIAVDAQGMVWIADGGSQTIVRWAPPYFHTQYFPQVAKS